MLKSHRQRLEYVHHHYRRMGYVLTVASHHDSDSDRWHCEVRVWANHTRIAQELLDAFEGRRGADLLAAESRKYLNQLATTPPTRAAARSGRRDSSGHAPAFLESTHERG